MAASKLPARAAKSRAARRLRMPAIEDDRLMRMLRIGAFGFTANLVPPDPLTDEQLRSIAIPVLLVRRRTQRGVLADRGSPSRRDVAYPTPRCTWSPEQDTRSRSVITDEVIAAMDAFLGRHREGAPADG